MVATLTVVNVCNGDLQIVNIKYLLSFQLRLLLTTDRDFSWGHTSLGAQVRLIDNLATM